MCSNNIDCLEIETNGSYCKPVTWIFIITVALIIGSSILGAWDVAQNGTNQHLQHEDLEMPFVAKNNNLEEDSSELLNSVELSQKIMTSSENSEDCFSGAAHPGTSDVSVPQKGWVRHLDTAPGEMIINEQATEIALPLPLKLTNATLEPYWVVVGVTGGYSWVDGYIKVIQTKSNDQFIWDDIKGIIDINGVLMPSDYGLHEMEYYNLTFTIRGSHPIILDANHEPVSPLGDFLVEFDGTDLDKFVDLKISTTWTGCDKPDQQFKVILAHKAMSQEKIPSSR